MNPDKILNEFISRNNNIDRDKAKRIVNENFLSLFPAHVLEYCANYEIVQDKLLLLTTTQINILSKIIKYVEMHKQDWIIPASAFISFVENPNYKDLIASLEGKLLTETELNALMFLTRNSFNYFNITDYEQLSKLKQIKNNMKYGWKKIN